MFWVLREAVTGNRGVIRVISGWHHLRTAFWTAYRPDHIPLIAGVALQALETMRPEDPTSLGMAACDALRHYGGAGESARLKALRPRLLARFAQKHG